VPTNANASNSLAAQHRAAVARPGRRIVASPLARRMAADCAVDIQLVVGSGPGGRVVKRDIEQHRMKPTAPESGAHAAAGRLRLRAGVDGRAVFDVVEKLNRWRPGASLSPIDVVVAAGAWALRRTSQLLGVDSDDIVVEILSESGLVATELHNADRVGLAGVRAQLASAQGQTEAGQAPDRGRKRARLTIAVIDLESVEEFDFGDRGGPRLTIGGVRPRAAPDVGRRLSVSFSAEAAQIDPAAAGRFVASFSQALQSPLDMIL